MKDINFDEILTEWSYRLPKGFPTVIDGRFTNRDEVIILNEILQQQGIKTITLPEARVYAHPDYLYVPNDRQASAFEDLGFNSSELEANPYKQAETLEQGKDYILVKGTSKLKKIDYDIARELVQRKDTVAIQSDAYPDSYLIVAGDVSQLTAKRDDTAAETPVKEGMVVLFYNSSVEEIPTEVNVTSILDTLLSVVDQVSDSGIDTLTKSKLSKFLEKLKSVKPKKVAALLTDYWSIASEIKDGGYTPANFIAIRAGLFDRIRSVAATLTKLYADKWCPGDIYLVEKSKYSAIESKLADIEKTMPADGVGIINSLFIKDWGSAGDEPDRGIVAVSLKEEKAQAGKAKQFLQTFSRKDVTYNVSNDEFSLTTSEIGKKIEFYRQAIAKLAKNAEVKVILKQDGSTAGMDEKKLREKFASLKLTYFLLGERGEDIDDNLLGAVAFGLSLSGVNPTFWKIAGSRSGKASRSEFSEGSTINLQDGGLGSKDSEIVITDVNSSNAVKFEMKIQKGGYDHLILLNARSNGGKQATLEIVKDKKV